MLTLHRPDSVFSLRHVPSWLMLCFAAGVVNAVTFLACGRFVTHVTGTVTRIGMEVVHLTLMLDYALVLAAFVAGAVVAGLLLKGAVAAGRAPPFALPLWLTSGMVALVAVAGQLGWLSSFGGSVDELGDFVNLCALSFAMGLQNAAVATSTGQLVRTTHLTGPATDLGIHLADLFVSSGAERALAKRHAALRTGKLLSYGLGAACAVPASARFGYLSLLIPAAVIAAATILSFAPFASLRSAHARNARGSEAAAGGSG